MVSINVVKEFALNLGNGLIQRFCEGWHHNVEPSVYEHWYTLLHVSEVKHDVAAVEQVPAPEAPTEDAVAGAAEVNQEEPKADADAQPAADAPRRRGRPPKEQ